jgi:hypothetical protein
MMKHYLTIIFAGLIIFLFSTCRQKPHVKEYYVVSTGDSTDFNHKNKNTAYQKPLPYPPPDILESNYYYKTVIIFDSSDLVYLYQTDLKTNENSIVKNSGGCIVNENDDFHKFMKYPNYLALQSENILKFSNKNFIEFVKTNNDIFLFDTTAKCLRLLIIASNKDTIINSAFYDLMNLIKKKKKNIYSVHYVIRLTTEEEDKVIFYKRRNLKYKPDTIKWSKNFLNGDFPPFTRQYDSVEKYVMQDIFKARKLFSIDSIKTRKVIN